MPMPRCGWAGGGAAVMASRRRVVRQARQWLGMGQDTGGVGGAGHRWSQIATDGHTPDETICAEDDHLCSLCSVAVADVPETKLRWLWQGRIPLGVSPRC